MTSSDKKDLQDLVKSFPDKGVTRFGGFLQWIQAAPDSDLLAAIGFENTDDLNSAMDVVNNEVSIRKLNGDFSEEKSKVDVLYTELVSNVAQQKPNYTADDYATDLFYLAMNTKPPGINADKTVAMDIISAPPMASSTAPENATFGEKYGKMVFVILSSIAGGALFGAVITPPLLQKFMPGDAHKKHRRWITVGMYAVGVAAAAFISMKVWDKMLAKSLSQMKSAGDDGKMNFTGRGTPVKNLTGIKRVASLNDPVGTKYKTIELTKGNGVNEPDVPANTLVTRVDMTQEYAKNMWWLNTDYGWQPLINLKKM